MAVRSALVGMAALAAGLLYGYGLGLLIVRLAYDCGQSDPGIASFGIFVFGVLVGLLLLPLVAAAITRMAFRLSCGQAVAGCALVTVVAWLGAVAGFLLWDALAPLPTRGPC